MPDWNQVFPYLFGAFGLAVVGAIGKGLQWLVSIPQRRSLSTVEAQKTLMEGKDSLHKQELAFKDQIIAERDRRILELEERIKVIGHTDRKSRD